MNQVVLVGRVTKDIELRTTTNGTPTCTFNLAIDRPKNRDGVRNADFPGIVAWNKTAELCAQYLHKGDRVGIVGSIQTRTYEKNGAKVYVTEVVANSIEFLTPKGQSGANAEPTFTGNVTADGFAEVDDGSLPF